MEKNLKVVSGSGLPQYRVCDSTIHDSLSGTCSITDIIWPFLGTLDECLLQSAIDPPVFSTVERQSAAIS